MFETQFDMARRTTGGQLSPLFVYAVETCIQLTLTELNENLREIYIEAYTHEEAAEYIHRQTAKELRRIFGSYQPELTPEDFYACELGSAGLMRGFMVRKCDRDFPLEKKLDFFLTMSLRSYKVPEEEIGQVRAFISGMDIRAISQQVMETLFQALAMRYALRPRARRWYISREMQRGIPCRMASGLSGCHRQTGWNTRMAMPCFL